MRPGMNHRMCGASQLTRNATPWHRATAQHRIHKQLAVAVAAAVGVDQRVAVEELENTYLIGIPEPDHSSSLAQPMLSISKQNALTSGTVLSLKRQRRIRVSREASQPEARVLGSLDQGSSGPLLSREQEVACCRLIQEAQALQHVRHRALTPAEQLRRREVVQLATNAQALLLQSYRRYITTQARKLQYNMGMKKASFDDMFMAGVLGLTQAAQRFKGDHQTAGSSGTTTSNARFLTFAHFYIRKAMIGGLKSLESNDVYIPRYLTDIKSKVTTAIRDLQAEAGTSGSGVLPSAKAVAARTGLPLSHVTEIINIMTIQMVGISDGGEEEGAEDGGLKAAWRMEPHAPGRGGQGAGGEAGLTVDTYHDLEAVERREDREGRLKALLSRTLGSREVEVLCLMMGVGRGQDAEQLDKTKAGALLGVSRQAVSQVYDRAVKKLQAACAKDAQLRRELEEVCEMAV